MESNEDRKLMKATPEWMKENYDRFNRELFGGELGDCEFEIFRTGSGSQGRTLGKFRLRNSDIRATYYDRSMYFDSYSGRKYINKENFSQYCLPSIMMNGNYSGTEEALLGTLVHEMCHYYDYMYGTCPKQAHGPSFRFIASYVSTRSGGRFTVQRLADAETMRGYELDDEMKEKNRRRVENKKAHALAIFVYRKDGEIELTLTSSNNQRVFEDIKSYYVYGKGRGVVSEIITSSDPALIDMLYQNGYRKIMRTWRIWHIKYKPWAKDIKKYEYNVVFKNDDMKENVNLSTVVVSQIIESVIDEYMSGIESGSVKVGGRDLELESPFEEID